MANVVNRTAVPIEILYSVNTPDYDPAQWIINPDLTILDTVPIHYIKIVGDLLVEMTVAEKAAVDAAELIEEKARVTMLVCEARESYVSNGPGVEYPAGSGKFFKVTDQDQSRWLYWQSMGSKWASLGLSFPFRVYSRDGKNYVDIPNANGFTTVVNVIGAYVVGLFATAQSVIVAVNSAISLAGVTAASSDYLANAPQNQT